MFFRPFRLSLTSWVKVTSHLITLGLRYWICSDIWTGFKAEIFFESEMSSLKEGKKEGKRVERNEGWINYERKIMLCLVGGGGHILKPRDLSHCLYASLLSGSA